MMQTPHPYVILAYHRVAELATDPQLLAVSPENFETQLTHLKNHFRCISFPELLDELANKDMSAQRTVVLTFDDGYADNLHHALPIARQKNVPFSVFVVTGQVDRDTEFWWDELERLILLPEHLPETLEVDTGEKQVYFDLGEDQHYTQDCASTYAQWSVLEDDPTRRHKVYRELHGLLYSLDPESRARAIEDLQEQTGQGTVGRESHRALRADEVRELDSHSVAHVGAHTVTHSVLAVMDGAVQKREIDESQARLTEILGHPVTSFSYPFGGRLTFTIETERLVEAAGFHGAVANFTGPIKENLQRYRLPRFLVRDWDGPTFVARLRTFFNQAQVS